MNWLKKLFKKSPDWISEEERLKIIEQSSKQVSRGVFFATIIIITSFLPVFMLTGQEGKLFHPLAYTKTFIMIMDALLVITLAPVLISFFMKGKFRPDNANPVNRVLEKIYEPIIRGVLKWRKTTIAINVVALVITIPGDATPNGMLPYDPTDPWAVWITFRGPRDEVRWAVGRDLLLQGLTDPAGEGDIQLWPSIDEHGRAAVVMELCSPDGRLVTQLHTHELYRFLTRTLALVPVGSEAIDLDELVADIIGTSRAE